MTKPTSPALLVTFFVVIMTPIFLNVGGVVLTPTRILLLIFVLPAFFGLLGGKYGKLSAPDLLMMAYSFWMLLALVMVHGVSRVPFAVITTVELFGGFLLGRMLIRNADDFRLFFKIQLYSMIFLCPFAVVELLTGDLVIPSILRHAFTTIYRGESAYGRMGLERVYTVFDHPILYGLYCSMALANLVMIAKGFTTRLLAFGFVTFMTFMSLSSAPLLAIGLQCGLLLWNWVMKGRWKLFIILSILAYVTVDALSNRTPITILIGTLTFNSGTGWTRIAIFESGWAAVMSHKLFGIGFNDWPRPSWLTASVDNFWLLTAMRYGLVGAGLLIAVFVVHLYKIAKSSPGSADAERYKVGYCIALVGAAFSLATVALWSTVSVYVMFYLGAGCWFYANPRGAEAERLPDQPGAEAQGESGPRPRYTRFPGRAATRRGGGRTALTQG